MYKIVANWKMYLTIQESRDLAARIATWWAEKGPSTIDLTLCPGTLAIHDVFRCLDGSSIGLGCQEIALNSKAGAFTGQLHGAQLEEAGVHSVIIGHSEIRQYQHFSDEMFSQQVLSAIAHKLRPIVCVGETSAEREAGQTDQVLSAQLEGIFSSQHLADEEVFIAYEPRWAIGNGKAMLPDEASRIHDLISHLMTEYHPQAKDCVTVLYGGSVDKNNVQAFLEQPSIKGVLIGSASVKPELFLSMLELLAQPA